MKRKILKRRFKIKDRVEIEWLDACAPGDNKWHDEPEFEDWLKDDLPIKDMGYVMAIDKRYVVLTGGYSDNDNYVGLYHRELKIPIGCIKRVRKL